MSSSIGIHLPQPFQTQTAKRCECTLRQVFNKVFEAGKI
jgi:hypothetical protein